MADRDRQRLELILMLIERIREQLASYDEARFVEDRDVIDSTAFRILSIGETVKRLSDDVKARHPHIDWLAIGAMRNVMAHNYEGIVPVYLWRVYTNHLASLADVAESELCRYP